MKGFFKEFKEFVSKGNVMDMAIGIIVGAAFTAIVTSLVNDIISPVIGLLTGSNFSELTATFGKVTFRYGSFVMAVINFFIIAFTMFLGLKGVMKMQSAIKKKEEKAEEEPATKECPFCKTEIAIEATRCPHCTSQLGVFEREESK